MPKPYPWLRTTRAGLYFDLAVYGLPNDRKDVDFSRLLEQKTLEAGGIKTLIAQNHYDERDFWTIYDRQRYERIKSRMDPDNLFRTVYEKMVAPHASLGRERAASRAIVFNATAERPNRA